MQTVKRVADSGPDVPGGRAAAAMKLDGTLDLAPGLLQLGQTPEPLRIQEAQGYHGLSIIYWVHKAFTVWPHLVPPPQFLPFLLVTTELQSHCFLLVSQSRDQEGTVLG